VKKARIVVLTVLITLAVVSAIGALAWKKIAAARKAVVVHVENVQRGELVEFITAPGLIEPKTKVQIRAKVTARIIDLPYEEGDRVTRGDPNANPPIPASVLVRLDAKDLESQLLSAEAGRAAKAAQIEVEKARLAGQQANLAGLAASLKQVERDLERQEALFESKDISQATFDQAQCKVAELKAQYDAAEHNLAAAQRNLVVLQHNLEAADAHIAQAREALSHTTITSPIDGVITRITSEVGELVVPGIMNSPGTLIMEVADLSQMLAVAHVSEVDVGKLQIGQKAAVRLDAFRDEEFTGVVDSIALAHGMWYGTKTFATEILLEATEEKLYWGLTAHVDIETRKYTDVLKVPSQAVLGRKIDGLPYQIRESSSEVDTAKTFATVVYRYVDGKAVVTPVKIGQSDLTHTIILAGITEEDKVIVGPYKVLEKLTHGQEVTDEREIAAKKKGSPGKG
jgi:HlyD family secretion protein